MTRLIAAAVAVLILSAATAAAQEMAPVVTGIDVDPSGNTATSIATIDSCRQVAPGDVFEIDLWVRDVPPPEGIDKGLVGFGYNFHFDGDILEFTSVDNQLMTTAAGEDNPFQVIEGDWIGGDDSLPSRTGNVRVDYVDLSGQNEFGEGVYSRITLTALKEGRSNLTLLDDTFSSGGFYPFIIDRTQPYPVSEVYNAVIAVGESCGPEPTPYVPDPANPPDDSIPTQEPTPTLPQTTEPRTPQPIGDTSLGVDVIPVGNTAKEIREIDACAAAALGDSFDVDVVVQEINNLNTFRVPVVFDPEVLELTDVDVDFILGTADRSRVLNQSGVTPNTTGTFVASAVDSGGDNALDSGSGVLLRVRFNAIAEGTSSISVKQQDQNNDGAFELGPTLRDDVNFIGSTDNDAYFDGPIADGEIRVGGECDDPDARVVRADQVTLEPDGGNGDDGAASGGDDGGESPLVWVVLGVAALAVVGGGAYFLLKRRQAAP